MAAPLETLDSSEVSYEMSYTEGFIVHHLMGLWLKEIPMDFREIGWLVKYMIPIDSQMFFSWSIYTNIQL